MSQEQERALMLRAAQAVLERVTSAIENELPNMMLETVLSGDTERMVRVSHPTAMDEPVYVRVTAHGLNTIEARRLFGDDPDYKGGKSPQDHTSAWANPPTPQAIRNGFTGEEAARP